MSTTTENLGLTKPELSENFDLSVWNGNTDILDAFAGQTNTALAGKQAALTTAQMNAANSGITAAKLTADEGALTGLVDSGAKNLLKDKQTTTTQEIKGITVVHDAVAGTLTVNGTHDGTGDAKFELYMGSYSAQTTLQKGTYVLDVGQTTGGSTVDGWAFVLTGLSVTNTGEPVEFTRSNDTGTIAPYLLIRGGSYTNMVFKPMLCTKADWAISHDFKPYCPTLQELYQMFLASQ